jgi:putative membrane-bound dehydrogenase-like protein
MLSALLLAIAAAGQPEPPRALDERLTIELFAAAPEIVTPTGIAVDRQGRLLVVESHTHFRPEGYLGPPADRIRIFEDTDGDGRADKISTFFEGTHSTMNLAVHHDGSVYVATRNEVFRLRDTDGDGQADDRVTLARLETPGDYPHNGLSGFAFDFAGDVYFGLGENLGADYKLIGTDGTTFSGGGEGGNIYRCRPDGTGLEKVATGFWNPFHLAFDTFGRLFAVDNDPDSRPPCRLLHIVPKGDYGYRFRNGRKGLHPFTAWNGELPGTLPMVAGTGEAPSGLVAYEADGLPADYLGQLLVTSWGDHRLERYTLTPRGASFSSHAEPFVVGGEDFRPVGIAIAADGSLFVSDWVDKSYSVHGKGRLWRVRWRERTPGASAAASPKTDDREAIRVVDRRRREAAARALSASEAGRATLRELVEADPNPRVRAVALMAFSAAGDADELSTAIFSSESSSIGKEGEVKVEALAARLLPISEMNLETLAAKRDRPLPRAEALRRLRGATGERSLLDASRDSDPFIRQAALTALAKTADDGQLHRWAADSDPAIRLAALLILREQEPPASAAELAGFLDDRDPTIRFAAVQWVAERQLAEFRPRVERQLGESGTRELFEACLAALERLDRAAAPAATTPRPDQEIAGEEYVARLLVAPGTSPDVRRRALRMLRPNHPALTLDRLRQAIGDAANPGLQLEAVRTLRESRLEGAASLLTAIAADANLSSDLRAEAVVGLTGQTEAEVRQLVALAAIDDAVGHEALRCLRQTQLTDEQRAAIGALSGRNSATADLVARVLHPESAPVQPAADDLPGWLKLLDGPADPVAGERVFFHPKSAGCFRCHQIDGRGGQIGPDLTTTAHTLDRPRLIDSILRPSREIAPRFVTYAVTTTSGRVFTGMLIGESGTGEQAYADSQGQLIQLGRAEIDERQPQNKSIMPDDLTRTLTASEFRDLLAYLRQNTPLAKISESSH